MGQIIPLAQVPPGRTVRVVQITGGSTLISRLYQMGILPGTMIHVIMNSGGPVIISVKSSSVALGRGMAHKILVELL